jgi:WbqC-like protein family
MPNRKVVAIHQPNFFPWLGYFDKIARADLFVLLDNVQFPKKGGTWTNRVQLAVGGKADWLTMPIIRSYHGVRCIGDMKINNSTPWRAKMLKTIQMNYARASFFNDVFPFLVDLVNNPTDSLLHYNVTAIQTLVEALHLAPSKLILGSTLNIEGAGTDLLIEIIKAVDGRTYLCGGGATGYQEDEKFAEAGIELIYQNFKYPVYAQGNNRRFISGLSVVDTLMHCGFEAIQVLLQPELM